MTPGAADGGRIERGAVPARHRNGTAFVTVTISPGGPMRRHTARAVKLLAALALCTVGGAVAVGCGSEKAVSHSGSSARARAVADAWHGSKAAHVWAQGYYPMGDVIQLPEGAFHSDADKRAYTTQNFVLRTALPGAPDRNGVVNWDDGRSLTLPLMGARKAYDSVARGSNDGPHLTVTGARLGETTVATSRGPATVPAWLFTLKGYDTPLKRVAVGPSKPPKPPIAPAAQSPSDELWPVQRLVGVSDDGRTVTVLAAHGACDDGPAVDVLETHDSVVLAASIVGTKDGPCTAQLLGAEKTVKLHRPLGERILLDAFTGGPMRSGSLMWG
ncbi:hypothetical protein [Streptomyces sp. NRRL S-646]|uniref:hypothetical protein n=1 Tax=Streptomyces sp. NRRL S-646 TaxID=1463917 RepID=UPI000B2E12B6|nr:hypothetical protein [Streptomyces sp. NRRL S-646]